MSAGRAGRRGGCRAGWPVPAAKPCVASRSSAVDSRTGAKVAIKKLYRPFQSELFAKRAYRELRLLKHMRHENVSRLGRRARQRPAPLLVFRLPARSCPARPVPPSPPLRQPPVWAVQAGDQGGGSKCLRFFLGSPLAPQPWRVREQPLAQVKGILQVSPQILWNCFPGRGS